MLCHTYIKAFNQRSIPSEKHAIANVPIVAFLPAAYLKNGWSWLDFVTTLTSYTPYLPGNAIDVSSLRAFRALRPLRTISAYPGIRLLVSTLIAAIPLLLDVVLLLGWVFFVFGIMGLQLFMGRYAYCSNALMVLFVLSGGLLLLVGLLLFEHLDAMGAVGTVSSFGVPLPAACRCCDLLRLCDYLEASVAAESCCV